MTLEIKKDIVARYQSGKLKDSHIKKFLKNYYDGNPVNECPTGCNSTCMLDCYIEIHQALVSDYGEKLNFKEPYIRDGERFCCGMELQKLTNGNRYCEVCGAEY